MTINSLTVDSDPSVTFSFSATNPSGAADNSVTEWQMTFPTTPTTLNLAPGSYHVTASAGVTLTDGTHGWRHRRRHSPRPSAAPSSSPPSAAPMPASTSSPRPRTAGAEAFSSVDGPFSASSDITLDSIAPTIGVTLDFDLSGNDAAGISGRFDVEPEATPEPSSAALGLIAATGFAGIVLRRRFARA
ncbi:MAG: PEP-CTERM sorting domain-containing protein [Verrucomicrobiota bacterium]